MGQFGPAGDGRVVSKEFMAEVTPEWSFKGIMNLSKQWWGKE